MKKKEEKDKKLHPYKLRKKNMYRPFETNKLNKTLTQHMALSLFHDGGTEEESDELYKLCDSRTEWEKRRRTRRERTSEYGTSWVNLWCEQTDCRQQFEVFNPGWIKHPSQYCPFIPLFTCPSLAVPSVSVLFIPSSSRWILFSPSASTSLSPSKFTLLLSSEEFRDGLLRPSRGQ